MKKFICNISEETNTELSERAKKVGVAKSAIVKIALDRYFKENEARD